MRKVLTGGLAVLGFWAAASAVQAQSMNVPWIVETVLGEICVPYAETGDLVAAVAAAEAAGYEIIKNESALLFDRSPPSGLVRLTRSHHGTVTLDLSYGRGLCAVGIFEGGPSTMAPPAAPFIARLGLEPVVVSLERQSTTDIAVWRKGSTQMVISRSPHFTPGSELVLSFRLP